MPSGRQSPLCHHTWTQGGCSRGPPPAVSSSHCCWAISFHVYLHSCFLPGGCSPQWDARGFCRCLGTRRNRNCFTPGSEITERWSAANTSWQCTSSNGHQLSRSTAGLLSAICSAPETFSSPCTRDLQVGAFPVDSTPRFIAQLNPHPTFFAKRLPLLFLLSHTHSEAFSRAPLLCLNAALGFFPPSHLLPSVRNIFLGCFLPAWSLWVPKASQPPQRTQCCLAACEDSGGLQ